jgi:hypothetical protein
MELSRQGWDGHAQGKKSGLLDSFLRLAATDDIDQITLDDMR